MNTDGEGGFVRPRFPQRVSWPQVVFIRVHPWLKFFQRPNSGCIAPRKTTPTPLTSGVGQTFVLPKFGLVLPASSGSPAPRNCARGVYRAVVRALMQLWKNSRTAS